MPSWNQLLKTTLLVCGISILGCGGGGAGGSGVTAQAASGTITLPPGFKLPMSRLAVATEAGQVPVTQTGSFKAPVSNSGPRLAQLIDTTTDKIVLLGYVDSSASGSAFAGGKSQISPLTTASALLYLGLSGPNLPPASWESFLESIMSSTQAATLAKTVTTSVTANPTAISDGDSAIEGGVAAVQASATPPSPANPMSTSPGYAGVSPASGPRVTVAQVTQTQTETGNLISVNIPTPQSGIVVEPNPNGDGIVVVNNLRRRAALYVYEVGVGQSVKTEVTFPDPLPLITDQEIEPEEGLDTVKVALTEGLQGKCAYTPKTTGPFALPTDKANPVTVYDVVVAGVGSIDTTSDVAKAVASTDPARATELAAEWSKTSSDLALTTWGKDVVVPILWYLALDANTAQNAAGSLQFEQNVENLAGSLTDVAAAFASHDLKLAAETFFKDVLNKPDLKASLIKIIGEAATSAGTASAETVEEITSRLESADTAMVVINSAFLTVDLTRVFIDSISHNLADEWVATVLQPKITLSPNPATVNDIQNIAILSVVVQNVTDLSNLRFKWSTSSNEGSLQEPTAAVPMPTGFTAFSQTAYVADIPKLKQGTTDTVTVTVFPANDLSTPLGTATAVVKGQPGTEAGAVFMDSDDDFAGAVVNFPWVLSEVVTCPFVKGATSYIVAASGPNTGQITYFVSTANGALQVLDGAKQPYDHYLADASGVKIAVFGVDAANDTNPAFSAQLIQEEFPINTVFITYGN